MLKLFKVDIDELEFFHLNDLVIESMEESQYLEVKEDLPGNHKLITKTIAAFSNSDGGWFILGVEENNEKITKLTPIDIDFKTANSKRIEDIVSATISPLPYYKIKSLVDPQNKNKEIIVIKVYPGLETPYITKDGIIYRRVHTASEPIRDQYIIQKIYENGSKFIDSLIDFSNYTWTWSKGGDESLSFFRGSIIPYHVITSDKLPEFDDKFKDQLMIMLEKIEFSFLTNPDYKGTIEIPNFQKSIRLGLENVILLHVII